MNGTAFRLTPTEERVWHLLDEGLNRAQIRVRLGCDQAIFSRVSDKTRLLVLIEQENRRGGQTTLREAHGDRRIVGRSEPRKGQWKDLT